MFTGICILVAGFDPRKRAVTTESLCKFPVPPDIVLNKKCALSAFWFVVHHITSLIEYAPRWGYYNKQYTQLGILSSGYILINIYTVMKMKTLRICLDKALEKAGITRYELGKRTDTKFQTIDKYYKNKVVRYDSDILLKICLALDCSIADIIEIVDVEEA